MKNLHIPIKRIEKPFIIKKRGNINGVFIERFLFLLMFLIGILSIINLTVAIIFTLKNL